MREGINHEACNFHNLESASCASLIFLTLIIFCVIKSILPEEEVWYDFQLIYKGILMMVSITGAGKWRLIHKSENNYIRYTPIHYCMGFLFMKGGRSEAYIIR